MFSNDYKPILSAVIPVGNLGRDITNLLYWIKEVDFSKVEIILVIDAIHKNNDDLILELRKRNKSRNLVIAYGNNSGPGSARNIGMKLTSAEWLVFWDSDDLPRCAALLKTIETLDISEFDAIVGSYEIEDAMSGKSRISLVTPDSRLSSFEKVAINPGIWRICFRTKLAKKIEFPNTYMGEDQVFIADFFTDVRVVKFVETNFYTYRKGLVGQLTGSNLHKRDISHSIESMVGLLRKSKNEEFTQILFLRLVLTGLLRGNIHTKSIVFSQFIKYILVMKIFSMRRVFRISVLIWKSTNVA